jgi:endonuclease/exonuclease/phosphatase family metal-dependent hydrolase
MKSPFRRLRLGLVVAGWTVVAALRLTAETLTVATYNIENYGPADRMTETGFRKEYPKPEAEKRALRAVIKALNADVLVLQEMGAQPYLDELQRDLKAEGLDYPHTALALADDADRHVAILSRRPLKAVKTHADLEFAYFGAKEKVKRGLLEASVTMTEGDVTLFAVHLKSRFTDRADDVQSTIRRTGEAAAVRDRVLTRFPTPATARFILLGDCNDTKGSKPIERLHARGKTVVGELLPAVDSHGETWTHFYRKEDTYSRVDYVIVSPGLAAAVQGRAAKIFDAELTKEASDHRPVMVTLEWPGK